MPGRSSYVMSCHVYRLQEKKVRVIWVKKMKRRIDPARLREVVLLSLYRLPLKTVYYLDLIIDVKKIFPGVSTKTPPQRAGFVTSRSSGPEGNRTPVRKSIP